MDNTDAFEVEPMPEPVLVCSDQHLAEIAERWRASTMLAMDTEFVRTDTFYAKLGLIQISDGTGCWLLDPLAINQWQPLVDLMIDPAITKVFHATSEDLEILNQHLGCVPEPLFDTQVAAAFCGYGFSLGYSALVKKLLGIELAKHETRSDWTQRPLSEAQLGYAAEDVHYLAQLYPILVQRLAESERSEWLAEDMVELVNTTKQPTSSEHYYLRAKSAWHLSPPRLAVLQQLCLWRETEARQQNKPRNRVVADKILLEIALHLPTNTTQLGQLHDMHPRIVRVYGEKLLRLVSDAQHLDESAFPQPLPQPLPREAGEQLKQLKRVAHSVADQLGIAPEVIARKKELEAILRGVYESGTPILPESLARGWRLKVIGRRLLAAAENMHV